MLKMIDEVLSDLINGVNIETDSVSVYVKKMLDVMEFGVNYTTSELMTLLNLKSRLSFRKNYLNPAIQSKRVKMSLPDVPTSKNQTYYKE